MSAGNEAGAAGSSADDTSARLQSILETVPDAIIVIDERGRIESFSGAAERMFGYRAAEVVGRNVSMLMPGPYREEHDGYLANYCRTGRAKILWLHICFASPRRPFPTPLNTAKPGK